jgi:hypothetical protein
MVEGEYKTPAPTGGTELHGFLGLPGFSNSVRLTPMVSRASEPRSALSGSASGLAPEQLNSEQVLPLG